MNKVYYIILSWNYKTDDQQTFDVSPIRHRTISSAKLCAEEIAKAELTLFSKVNEVARENCELVKDETRSLWTISVKDKSKPYTFRAEVVECIL